LAVEFAKEGACVGLAARRVDRLAEVKARIESAGGKALAVECDVTDRASLDAAVAQVVAAFGGLDVAVANAGFGIIGPFDRLDTEAFRRQYNTNVFGVIDTIYAVLPHLIASKGRLGIMASVLGHVGLGSSAPYCSSKFALVGLAESILYELAPKGVSVTSIAPGLVETEIWSVDKYGKFNPRRKVDIFPSLRVPVPKAARAILLALHARRFEAVITGHGKLIKVLHRLFPRTFRAALRRLAATQRGKQAAARSANRG